MTQTVPKWTFSNERIKVVYVLYKRLVKCQQHVNANETWVMKVLHNVSSHTPNLFFWSKYRQHGSFAG